MDKGSPLLHCGVLNHNFYFTSLEHIYILQGTEETVRVVSMDKDFHVDCYICEVRL
jgi:hypothetical protein